MKKLSFLTLFILSLSFLLSCGKDDDYDRKKAISFFVQTNHLWTDPELEKTAIILPSQTANQTWNGSAAEQNQKFENIAKNFTTHPKSGKALLKETMHFWPSHAVWKDYRFAYSPVIANNKIFSLNNSGTLISFDLKTQKQIWKSQIFPKLFLKNYQTPKIYLSANKIYAIAGSNRVVSSSLKDGKVLWSKDISAIPVSTPVSDGNLVYVITNDNKLYALDATNGDIRWTHNGITRPTTMFGAADPVIYKNFVIASYSSGEIYALNKSNGDTAWSQDLNLSKAINSDFYLTDIDATPLAKDDVIYSIGNGGLMMAIKSSDGNYLWKKEIAGVTDFWLAGNFLFLINNENKLMALHKKTGGIKWISQLANFEEENQPTSKIIYNGVMMVGNRLLISNTKGEILLVSPMNGEIENTFKTGRRLFRNPIVVNGKIYLQRLGKFWISLFELE